MATDKGLEDRAFTAYLRRAAREANIRGGSVIQPSRPQVAEVEGKQYVVLSNINGILAVYRVRQNGSLKGLIEWPRELSEAFE